MTATLDTVTRLAHAMRIDTMREQWLTADSGRVATEWMTHEGGWHVYLRCMLRDVTVSIDRPDRLDAWAHALQVAMLECQMKEAV